MIGVWVREVLLFFVMPSGIIGSYVEVGYRGEKDWESSLRLSSVEAVEDGGGSVSARSWEVVVKRRFGGIGNDVHARAWPIRWRQGRHTDPIEGSWNSERFMVAGIDIDYDVGAEPFSYRSLGP